MRKVNEILRLHFEQKLGQRQIARSANVSQSTVSEYLARAQAAGLAWPLPEEWDETRLQAALFPLSQTPAKRPARPLPDFTSLRQERQQHRDRGLHQHLRPDDLACRAAAERGHPLLGLEEQVLPRGHSLCGGTDATIAEHRLVPIRL